MGRRRAGPAVGEGYVGWRGGEGVVFDGEGCACCVEEFEKSDVRGLEGAVGEGGGDGGCRGGSGHCGSSNIGFIEYERVIV